MSAVSRACSGSEMVKSTPVLQSASPFAGRFAKGASATSKFGAAPPKPQRVRGRDPGAQERARRGTFPFVGASFTRISWPTRRRSVATQVAAGRSIARWPRAQAREKSCGSLVRSRGNPLRGKRTTPPLRRRAERDRERVLPLFPCGSDRKIRERGRGSSVRGCVRDSCCVAEVDRRRLTQRNVPGSRKRFGDANGGLAHHKWRSITPKVWRAMAAVMRTGVGLLGVWRQSQRLRRGLVKGILSNGRHLGSRNRRLFTEAT